MSIKQNIGTAITYAGVMARAAAYGIRAARTRQAVERMEDRFKDRAASARYLSEAMTVLSVDEPTTTAYMEIATISNAMAGNVAQIVAASESLATAAQGLAGETESQHGRMADANRTHSVQMAEPVFNQRH